VFTHDSVKRLFRPLSRPVLTIAAATLLLGVMAGPAAADTPEGWEKAPDVSPLGFLLVLAIIPLGAAAVISLLALLPTIIGDKGYEPGQSWRGDTEWFGGPTKGVAAADDVTPQQIEQSSQGTGGTSGRW
jgi:hypothetical protein